MKRKNLNKEMDKRFDYLDKSVVNRIKSKTQLPNTIAKYKDDLIHSAMSINTANEYAKEIERFAEWKNGKFGSDITNFTRDDIIKYKDYARTILENNATTINRKLAALKGYNDFLIEQGIMDKNVIIKKDYIKVQAKFANPSTISEDVVNEFLNEVQQTQSLRNYAISCILVYCGLRISECLNLEINFVDLNNNQMIVRNGKGDKERIVYMNNKTKVAINNYLKNERNSNENRLYKNSKYLFISRQSDKLTTQSVHSWMKKICNKIHPHLLRHFFCSNALQKGFDISEIMNQAGHSNIQTTMRYTNPTASQMKLKMENL